MYHFGWYFLSRVWYAFLLPFLMVFFSLKAIKSKLIWRRLCVFTSFFAFSLLELKLSRRNRCISRQRWKWYSYTTPTTTLRLHPLLVLLLWSLYSISSTGRGGGVAVVHIHPQPLQQPHNTCIVRWITMCWHIHFHISTRDEVKNRETWHFIFKKLLIGKRGGQMMDE